MGYKMEQKNITLSSLAWKIEISEFERERISCLLSNIDHPASNIFKEYIRKYSGFHRIARSLQKEINGFRVGSKNYHKKAIDFILKELQSGINHKISWKLYLNSMAEYFFEELSAFNTLMSEVKVEVEVEVDSPIDSTFILKEICKHASEFEVDEKAITEVYELWPFERQSNFAEILSEVGKHAELGEVQRDLKELSQKIDLIKDELPATIKQSFTKELKTKRYDEKLNHLEGKINESINQLFQTEFSKIQESTSSLVIRVDKLEKEFSESKLTTKKSLSDISNLVEEQIDKLGSNVKKSQKFENNIVDVQSINAPYQASHNKMHFKWFNQRKEIPLKENIDEKIFVKRFSEAFNDVNSMIPVNYHSLLASSPVIILNNSEVADAWIDALGWSSYVYRIAASPTWSSVDDWYDGAEFIFSEKNNNPKILLIYDFDIGLVEGYLLPILKVWRSSGYGQPYEKIVLISSNDHGMENNKILEPVIWLPEKHLNNAETSTSPFILKQHQVSQSAAISTKAFVSWLNQQQNSECSNKLKQKTHQFLNELKNIEIQFPLHVFRKVDFLLVYLTKNGNSNIELMNLVIQSLILPWVAAHHGKAKMEEVVDYCAKNSPR